jgi:site-specific DNA-methyltransferase (adenine-specific)
MAHQSENVERLPIHVAPLPIYPDLLALDHAASDVWFLVLPFGRRLADAERSTDWPACLRTFAQGLGPNAVLAVLTTPQDAAALWPELSKTLHLKLWIAVKLHEPLDSGPGRLPEHHAALLILSRYSGSLQNTKTRIAYTYCPACEKTTKDYGGKKQNYHSYGTLISDVWRDLAWNPGEAATPIAQRLADLFGLPPHQRLHFVDLRGDAALAPKPQQQQRPHSVNGAATPLLRSQLRQGDCLKILRALPADSVDFCFADPPYNLAKPYDSCDDSLDVLDYFRWCDQWLDQLARVLKPGRSCAVLNIPQRAMHHFSHLRRRLQFQTWIAWEGRSLPARRIMPAHYAILCFSKGDPRPLPGRCNPEQPALRVLQEGFCLRSACATARRRRGVDDRGPLTDLWWDVHRLMHKARRVDHPCQLPPALMSRLIALFTAPGELVLDPFNGAGTTTLCAEALNRRFLGVELSEPYHRLASERRELLRRGGDPFAREARTPAAKNNRVKRIGTEKYEVSKKVLQLEVRDIARRMGRLPTRAEVAERSQYPIRYFDSYFLSWGEVCAAARTTGMKETKDDKRKSVRMNHRDTETQRRREKQ